jgi:hypothetical protein
MMSADRPGLGRFAGDPVARAVRASLTPDLLKPVFAGGAEPLAGHCYVASEAYFHLVGGAAAGWTPVAVQHEGGPHWWLRGPGGRIVDLTAEQFRTPVPYGLGRGKGFLTSQPSRRAAIVMGRARTLLAGEELAGTGIAG